MKRVLCLWLPGWAIQRLRHVRPELERQPLVLFQPGRGKLLVTARSRAAARQGVAVGMPLAEARALTDHARFESHEPRADRQALRKLALWCQRFTPVVALEEGESPESLLLDITGCGPLFGGEESLARKVVAEFRRRRFWVAAAVADTIGAAWAIAHAACGLAGAKPQAAVVPSGKQAEALSPLPVETLRLPGHVLDLLHEFDIRRIGQLLALPRAEVPAHFGLEVVQRLDQALGKVPELLKPERALEPVEISWDIDPPTADRRLIETVFDHLLEQILERLPPHVGVQRLVCSLRTSAEEPVRVLVNLLRPSASTRHLRDLARLHFERVRLAAEASAMTVRADIVGPLEFHQEQIFENDLHMERWRKFPLLIERLTSRLGETAVVRPRLWPDVQPEFAWRAEPWLRHAKRTTDYTDGTDKKKTLGIRDIRVIRGSRPLCLKARPVAISVMSLVPGGPPLRFEWQGKSCIVAHYRGPERIETGWWRAPDVRRDYYLVETTTGERFWMFQKLIEESWFVHGSF